MNYAPTKVKALGKVNGVKSQRQKSKSKTKVKTNKRLLCLWL